MRKLYLAVLPVCDFAKISVNAVLTLHQHQENTIWFYDVLHSIIMMNSAVLTAGWEQLRSMHSAKPSKNKTNACFRRPETHQMFGGVLLCSDTETQSKTPAYNPKINSCVCDIWHCLTLCFSVGTWEDTTKCMVSFTSFKTSIYCIFWRIVWVHMLRFQPAVM